MEKCDFSCARCGYLISIPQDPDSYNIEDHCRRTENDSYPFKSSD